MEDTKTYSLEVQQAVFGNWNKTFEETNTLFDDSWKISQNAIKGLSNGNINAYQAYNTFAMGENQMMNLHDEYDEMIIPKQLTAEHQTLLKEAADSMADACWDRAIALDKTQQYLDDPKPSLLSESNVMAQGGQEAMLNAMMKITQVDDELNPTK